MERRIPWWQGVVLGLLVAWALLSVKGAVTSSEPDYRPPTSRAELQGVQMSTDSDPPDGCTYAMVTPAGLEPTEEDHARARAASPSCREEVTGGAVGP